MRVSTTQVSDRCIGTYQCSEPSCKTKSRQLLNDGRCFVNGCKGRVIAVQFSERVTNETLRYLQGLFDTQKYRVEASETKIDEHPHEEEFRSIKAVVDAVIDNSRYNKVDLGSIFSFMDK